MPQDVAYGGTTFLVPPDVLDAAQASAADLKGLVGAFRGACLPAACPDQDALLNQLVAHTDAQREWRNFFAGRVAAHPFVILSRLLGMTKIAEQNSESKDQLERIKKELAELSEAATTLERYFANRPMLIAGDDGETQESARATDQQMKAARTALRWAQDYLLKQRTKAEHIYYYEFPTSQKRSRPNFAFGIQLCREFEGAFGEPRYDFAVALTHALFQRGDVNSELLAKAYRADRKLRPLAGRFWFAAPPKS